MQQNTKTFQENIFTIFDELHLAKQWGKASILFTIHKSIHGQEKTKQALRKKLEETGYSIVELEINKIEGNFIDFMIQQESIESIVFYISNIGWGGGEDERDGYRNLNFHRETLVEKKIKAVFFLTLTEASNMPNYAPDFWAFRHRVLKFGTPRAGNQRQPPVGLMLWHIESPLAPTTDIKSKISSRTNLLKELPDQMETVSSRIDFQYEIGYLYWRLGDYLKAEKSLSEGLGLAKTYDLDEALVKLQNGLAILCYDREKYKQAVDLLAVIVEKKPRDCLLNLNQAIVLFAMKKRYNAIRKGRKATSLCPQNPWVWNSLGFLYYFAGTMDDAVNCFQKAIIISPGFAYFYEALAICYLTIGLTDKAKTLLHQAENYLDDRETFRGILKEYIEGNTKKASLLLKEAKNSGKLSELDLTRDPAFNALVALI